MDIKTVRHATLVFFVSMGSYSQMPTVTSSRLEASEPPQLVLPSEPQPLQHWPVTLSIEGPDLTSLNSVRPATSEKELHSDCCEHQSSCTICVPQKTAKNQRDTLYRSQTKTVCLPRCGWVLLGACPEECIECGRPRTVRVLLKKVVDHPQPAVRCVPITKK